MTTSRFPVDDDFSRRISLSSSASHGWRSFCNGGTFSVGIDKEIEVEFHILMESDHCASDAALEALRTFSWQAHALPVALKGISADIRVVMDAQRCRLLEHTAGLAIPNVFRLRRYPESGLAVEDDEGVIAIREVRREVRDHQQLIFELSAYFRQSNGWFLARNDMVCGPCHEPWHTHTQVFIENDAGFAHPALRDFHLDPASGEISVRIGKVGK